MMYSQRKKNGVDAAYVPMFHGGIPVFNPKLFLQNEKQDACNEIKNYPLIELSYFIDNKVTLVIDIV